MTSQCVGSGTLSLGGAIVDVESWWLQWREILFSNFVVVVAGVVFCEEPFSMNLERFFFKLWLIVVCAIRKAMAKKAIEAMNFPPRSTQRHLVNWVGSK